MSPVVEPSGRAVLRRRVVAGVLLLLVLLAAIVSVRALVSAFVGSSSGGGGLLAEPDGESIRRALERDAGAFAGRSLFLIPPPPAAEEPEVVESEPEAPVVLAPSRYAGPGIIAMVFDTVWFEDGTKLSLEEPEHTGEDLELVSVDAPWSARVRWRGAEFDVTLFRRDSIVYPKTDAPDEGRKEEQESGTLSRVGLQEGAS